MAMQLAVDQGGEDAGGLQTRRSPLVLTAVGGGGGRSAGDNGGAAAAAEAFDEGGFASANAGMLVLANTLLGGSGMLGIPHAFSLAGWFLGAVLVVAFGCASAFGSHLLHCSARQIGSKPCSFYSVASNVAPRWTWLIDGAVMLKCFGVGTSYLIIVGDLLPPATGLERWQAVTGGFLVGGLLSCLRNLSALRFTATVSVVISAWTVLMIGLFFFRVGSQFEPCETLRERLPCADSEFEPVAGHDLLALGKALPVFIFGFTCQQNVFTICNELERPTQARMDGIIIRAYVVGGVAFLFAALFGYGTYGDRVGADILKGYPQKEAVQLSRILFSLLATFSYPLQAHPSRASSLALWSMICDRPTSAGREVAFATSGCGGGSGLSGSQRFVIATTIGLSLSYLIAVTLKDLETILAIVGATGSTMVSYILPGLCYVRAFPNAHPKRALALLQLVAGCVIMPTCLTLVFI